MRALYTRNFEARKQPYSENSSAKLQEKLTS